VKPKHKETIDQRLIRALAHPMRVQILEILCERIASPNAIAEALKADLGHVAYHTRTLDRCGCLDLVETAQRRGATEHFYRARAGSFIGDRQWRQVPRSLRGGVSAASVQTFFDRAVAALEAGTIDGRDDTVLTWMPLWLDPLGWDEVTAILEEARDRVLTAQAGSLGRLEKRRAREEAVSTVVALFNFETGGSQLG
jgi:DNA-binding transcriptional ArsR family regulator